jgi:hypothetical protein
VTPEIRQRAYCDNDVTIVTEIVYQEVTDELDTSDEEVENDNNTHQSSTKPLSQGGGETQFLGT